MGGGESVAAASESGHGSVISKSADLQLYTQMRKLWSDHVIWTREYIVAAVGGSPSADAVSKRLMKNQEDIGQAIAQFYGTPAGDQLTKLLKEHITIAVDIVTDAKGDDQPKFKADNDRWQANANQIAGFLSRANPNWPKSTLEDMMNKHLTTTADELNAHLKKQYSKDVAAFDAVYDHILHMSDALSDGIVKQFPDKFSNKMVASDNRRQ
jgi:hypothetical protein